MKTAIFPGSFDPITLGHQDIINRGLNIFDKIIIAIGHNQQKTTAMFSLERRMEFVQETFLNNPKIQVTSYSGLTVKYCKDIGADFILRGLRNPADFEFEKAIAHTNRRLMGVETIFLLTASKTSYISSSIVRDVIKNKGDYTLLVPPTVKI